MILPNKIEIQIIDDAGEAKPKANVLLGLKIFTEFGSWYNYSFFMTNSEGHTCLTKQQIIDNTELKWANYIESDVPTKFELYVWDGQSITTLIESMKRLLSSYKDETAIEKDLLGRAVKEDNLSEAMKVTREKSRNDTALFEQIKDVVNNKIQVPEPKIEGVWLDALPKQYKFVVD